jgi:hypothetical protein
MKRRFALIPLLALLGACSVLPETQRAERASVKRSTLVFTPNAETRQCLAQLGSTRANFTPLPDQYYGAGCSTVGTVKLASLKSDRQDLALSNLGPVTCPLAETFASWVRFGVDRAAQQILGSALVRIETMGSYSCRNVAGTGRRSGHATASAIDVSGFVLADGRRVTLLQGWVQGTAAERKFLQTIHSSACKRFGMVLGPAYNAAHRDHLHLELSGRGMCR